MSNHNRIENPEINTVMADTNEGQQQKQTFVGKMIKARDRIMLSKTGRFLVKASKILAVVGVGVASYKAGANSVKPTTVYIKEGVNEEEPIEETEKTTEETGEAVE